MITANRISHAELLPVEVQCSTNRIQNQRRLTDSPGIHSNRSCKFDSEADDLLSENRLVPKGPKCQSITVSACPEFFNSIFNKS